MGIILAIIGYIIVGIATSVLFSIFELGGLEADGDMPIIIIGSIIWPVCWLATGIYYLINGYASLLIDLHDKYEDWRYNEETEKYGE